MSRKILILHGPNLNLLGKREPHIYGSLTLAQINAELSQEAKKVGVGCEFFQSNHEGDIVDFIQNARGRVTHIIINAGAYTHTSVAIRDALLSVDIPFIEVHLSNVYQREPFRHHSYLSDKATAVICGLGMFGYKAALSYFAQAA